ncbi:Mu-like prophage major head subunit gpT family protein [Pseudomonas aeruginosa]
MDGRIESDTAWFLLDTTKPVKPFIFQPSRIVAMSFCEPRSCGKLLSS